MARRKQTFQQVADLAKVSLATVSRVANGSARVSPPILQRVREAAAKLGVDLYRQGKANVIAFLLCNRDLLHPFHSRVLVAAEAYCAAHNYNMLFLSFRYPPNIPWREVYAPPILQRRDVVRAVIVAGVNSQNFIDVLHHKGIPFAILGNNLIGSWHPEKCDVVWFDDIQGGYEATRFLQSLGHHDIWFVGNSRLPWFARRFDGYRMRMEEAGLTPQQAGIDSGDEQEVGYLATKSILVQKKPVTAIFTGSDPAADGTYRALRDFGLRAPEDISVVGYNDIEAPMLHPALTTVRVFPEQIGQRLAEAVLNRLTDPDLPPQQFTIPTQLVKRDSCRDIVAAPARTGQRKSTA
ncbi:MAG: LacI family DNA-binding transcriptional regulator [Terriglobia bacterium]